ncbi:MAG TPA: 3'-5' exonuclease, partial [Candidatus Omnitrophota bacterium]|nr:3'-5' exonuclease [Candidatus Omnitrophota bacterium]
GRPFHRNNTETGEVISLKKKILADIRELFKSLPEGTKQIFQNSLSRFLDSAGATFDLGSLPQAFGREEFPVNKNGCPSKKVLKLWADIRDGLKAVSELESICLFNPYIDIFDEFQKGLLELSGKDDVLFLEELNRRTMFLFDDSGVTVPELYYRLAVRLFHFLVDEFQDTSLLQWKNLDPMINEALSKGGSLFYVGDKKQAIYRFRGGESGLFDSVKSSFHGYEIIDKTLTRNYRSRKNIVDFCNECFSSKNLLRFFEAKNELSKSSPVFCDAEKEEVLGVFKNAFQDTPEGRDGGCVSIERLQAKTSQEAQDCVKERLMALLKELSTRFDNSDIAILARQNDEAEQFTEWLIEEGIRVESEKTLNIRNNAHIKEIISFLMFLNSPIDDLSFASFILGDIFAKASGKSSQEYRDFLFSAAQKKKNKHIYLYKEFRDAYPDEWADFIEGFFKSVGFVPLYELIISIYKELSILKNFGADQGFFMKLLEVVKEKEEDVSDLAGFIEYFTGAPNEELYVRVSGTDSIKVLTIHKSKGLEFPVVIIPFLEMNVRVDQDLALLEGDKLVLRRLSEKYRAFSPYIEEAYRKQYLKCFIDELNSIYVALTRAEDELYVLLSEKSGRSNNLACALIPDEKMFHAQKVVKVPKKQKQAHFKIPVSKYQNWIEMLQDEFPFGASISARGRRQRGEVLHYLLSFLGDLDKEDSVRSLSDAFVLAKSRYRTFLDWEAVEKDLAKFLKNREIRPFFYCQGAKVFTEKEFVDKKGNTKRIDRLIVSDKEVWIADFKSSKEPDAFEQLMDYKKIMMDLYPDKFIRCFVLNLDAFSAEEVNG